MDETLAKIVSKVYDLWNEEVKKHINLEQLADPRMVKLIKDKLVDSPSSNFVRLINVFRYLKFEYIFHKARVLTAKLSATRGDVTTIYGYIYATWPYDESVKFDINYVCYGPTFKSMDGEYRSRFTNIENFLNSIEINKKQFEIAEQYILERISNEDLDIHVDLHVHDEFKHKREFMRAINDSRLPIKLLTAAWICDALSMPSHVNNVYPQVIIGPHDAEVISSMDMKKISIDLEYPKSKLAKGMDHVNLYINSLAVGQKIFPMSLREITRREDITFPVWREIYISELASNCVLNYISPSFPASSNWFYIQKNKPSLYDNENMHEKFNHSKLATNITTQLKHIDKMNYRKREPINNKFLKLSIAIESSIMVSDSEIRLSDLALCLTNENVGKTFANIILMITRGEELVPSYLPTNANVPKQKNKPRYQLKYIFNDHEIFTKHIFELIYGFLCIHQQLKIMHGDPHMNNVTIKNEIFAKPAYTNYHTIYIVDGVPYQVPYTGLVSSFIDFSRGIIGDKNRIEHEFGKIFMEIFFKDQNNRILGMVYNYFPDLISRYRIEIESLLMSNFDLVFKIITSVDVYSLCSNLLYMMELSELFSPKKSSDIYVENDPSNIKLLKAIIADLDIYIHHEVERLCKGQIKKVTDVEWGAAMVIKKHFVKLTNIKLEEHEYINNVFSASNPLTYDISDLDNMGPFLSPNIFVDVATSLGVDLKSIPDSPIDKWEKYKKFDETETVSHMIHQIEEQERTDLQFEPWMLL